MKSIFVAEASDVDRAAVYQVSPLAADLLLECGPFLVPAGLAGAPGHAEVDDGAESDALRAFLNANPWEGMASVTRTAWLLLARNGDTVVFGQRDRPVGMGTVVTLAEVNGRLKPRNLGGSRLLVSRPDDRAEIVRRATTSGASVTLMWDSGEIAGHVPNRVLSTVKVLETATAVHFMLVSAPNPDRPASRPGRGVSGVHKIRMETASITLEQPLNGRTLFNNHRIPASPIDVQSA